VAVPARRSGERGLAIQNQLGFVVSCLSGERVVLLLKPNKFGLEVTYSLLETAHLGNHTRIWTADVAE
jgi:hypothetical protein